MRVGACRQSSSDRWKSRRRRLRAAAELAELVERLRAALDAQRRSERTLVTSSSLLTGLVRKSSAPHSTARSTSPTSLERGDHDDGMSACPAALEFLADLKPLIRGIMTSRKMMSGWALDLLDKLGAVEGADGAVEFLQIGLEEFDVLSVVVDDEMEPMARGV